MAKRIMNTVGPAHTLPATPKWLPTHSAVHPHHGRRSSPAVPTGYKPDPYHQEFPKKPPTKASDTGER